MEDLTRSKKISINTLYMYCRMLFLTFISLFTVRIVMKNLGVEDYGIYNLIAGVVVLFNFIASSSSAATSRYLNYALGKNDKEKANRVYSSSVIIHITVGLIIFVLSETIGLWLLKYYLVIPSERIPTANLVFQFSTVSTLFGIINIPNNASIISHEKMSFYAIISIFEGIFKLLIAFFISIYDGDKLIIYSLLLMLVTVSLFILNKIYVTFKFEICHFKFHKDKDLYKELISFSGWSLLSSVGSTCSSQVLNMILNRFFGVIANAAMGIANQVNNTVYQLISNFQIAFEPQITKSYAANEKEFLNKLIFRTSKFSFFLLWFFILPLFINVDVVLKVWLQEVAPNTEIFLRIVLMTSLMDAILGPLWMSVYATGKNKKYEIASCFFNLLLIPLTFLFFKIGFPPYFMLLLKFIERFLIFSFILFYLKKIMDFNVCSFIKDVFLRCLLVSMISFLIVILFCKISNEVIRFFSTCVISVLLNISLIFTIGLEKGEKIILKDLILAKIVRIKKHDEE